MLFLLLLLVLLVLLLWALRFPAWSPLRSSAWSPRSCAASSCRLAVVLLLAVVMGGPACSVRDVGVLRPDRPQLASGGEGGAGLGALWGFHHL